jgi:hypothetical protein
VCEYRSGDQVSLIPPTRKEIALTLTFSLPESECLLFLLLGEEEAGDERRERMPVLHVVGFIVFALIRHELTCAFWPKMEHENQMKANKCLVRERVFPLHGILFRPVLISPPHLLSVRCSRLKPKSKIRPASPLFPK